MPNASGNSDISSGNSPFEFSVKRVKFESKYIGWEFTPTKWHMKNTTKERFAWKLKCTSNYHFEISKPCGFLMPGESVEHVVHFRPGVLIPSNGLHHFSIYWAKTEGDEAFARQFWSSRRPDGCVHLKVDYTERANRYVPIPPKSHFRKEDQYERKKEFDERKTAFFADNEYPIPKRA